MEFLFTGKNNCLRLLKKELKYGSINNAGVNETQMGY